MAGVVVGVQGVAGVVVGVQGVAGGEKAGNNVYTNHRGGDDGDGERSTQHTAHEG